MEHKIDHEALLYQADHNVPAQTVEKLQAHTCECENLLASMHATLPGSRPDAPNGLQSLHNGLKRLDHGFM